MLSTFTTRKSFDRIRSVLPVLASGEGVPQVGRSVFRCFCSPTSRRERAEAEASFGGALADRQRAPICCPDEDPIYRSKIHNESHPLLTAPSAQLAVGRMRRPKRGGRQYLSIL